MYLTVVSFISFLAYYFTNKRKSLPRFKLSLDSHIPYISWFVAPYILLYPLIIFSYLSLEGEYLEMFTLSILISNTMSGIFWYFVPNGVVRSKVRIKNFLDRIINYIYSHDGDTNGFPSGHVFLTIICAFYLNTQNYNPIYYVLAILIILSTVLTKQHYVVDILGGGIVAVITIFITSILFI